jgi:hypothetical protein
VALGVIAFLAAPICGAGAASNREEYFVLSDRPQYVVVRIEDDRVFAAQAINGESPGVI